MGSCSFLPSSENCATERRHAGCSLERAAAFLALAAVVGVKGAAVDVTQRSEQAVSDCCRRGADTATWRAGIFEARCKSPRCRRGACCSAAMLLFLCHQCAFSKG